MSTSRSKQPKESIEVALVCAPPLLRLGLERILRTAGRIQVSSYQALPRRPITGAVAVICDRGQRGAARTCEQARERGAHVVVVLRRAEPELVIDCLVAGALGFVAEGDDPGDLGTAVAAAALGRHHLGGEPLSLLLDWLRAQRRSPSERSRRRDRDLLELLAAGRTTAEIAERLGIAPKTVRNQASLLYRRLGVRSRAQAAIVAEKRGLLD